MLEIKETVHLNLHKKWFDMIKSGEKKEEYREIKEHFVRLLFNWRKCKEHKTIEEFTEALKEGGEKAHKLIFKYGKRFETVTFSNGYKKDRPQIVKKFKFMVVFKGKKSWGAPPENCLIIALGNV
jgi:hypothetical protein